MVESVSEKAAEFNPQVKGSVAHPLQPRLVKEEWTGKAIVFDPINQVFISLLPLKKCYEIQVNSINQLPKKQLQN